MTPNLRILGGGMKKFACGLATGAVVVRLAPELSIVCVLIYLAITLMEMNRSLSKPDDTKIH
ncbi:hypothetical protein A3F39_02740 [Candidatus Berkelbacteria bacterium RIFCSPHIGHO2_12_FULL_50_11]|nr:MAG: hypothetical protein A3F39_02740 [Candidatus Berkelbacteria bacterium RIFCSPHIGHO2_12_FULL_50_11]